MEDNGLNNFSVRRMRSPATSINSLTKCFIAKGESLQQSLIGRLLLSLYLLKSLSSGFRNILLTAYYAHFIFTHSVCWSAFSFRCFELHPILYFPVVTSLPEQHFSGCHIPYQQDIRFLLGSIAMKVIAVTNSRRLKTRTPYTRLATASCS